MTSTSVIRYTAPEVAYSSATLHSDTYSFTMLMFECITEEIPFSDIPLDADVNLAKNIKKQRPPRPDGEFRVSDELWDLMERCWSQKPESRSTMDEVYLFFTNNPQSVQTGTRVPPPPPLPQPSHPLVPQVTNNTTNPSMPTPYPSIPNVTSSEPYDVLQPLSGSDHNQVTSPVGQDNGLSEWGSESETRVDQNPPRPTWGRPSTNQSTPNSTTVVGGLGYQAVGSYGQPPSLQLQTVAPVTSYVTAPTTQMPSPNIPQSMNPSQPTNSPGPFQDSGVTTTQEGNTNDDSEFLRGILAYVDWWVK
jgi:hypothetical protein